MSLLHTMIDRDPAHLDPTFRERVEELLRRLKAKEHDPILWEGKRSFARAEWLVRQGRRAHRKSMHCYNLAVDIIDRFHRWDVNPKANVFWKDLGETARELGLEAGYFWDNIDRPHVQALPHSADAWVRNATAAEIAERVAQHLDSTDPSQRDTVRERVTPIKRPLAAVEAPQSKKDPRSSS